MPSTPRRRDRSALRDYVDGLNSLLNRTVTSGRLILLRETARAGWSISDYKGLWGRFLWSFNPLETTCSFGNV